MRKIKRKSKNRKQRKLRRPLQPLVETQAEQLEKALKHILSGTLALYILSTSKKPISTVVQELTDTEIKAGEFVTLLTREAKDVLKVSALRGSLAGAFSFMPFGSPTSTDSRKAPKQRARFTKKSAINRELRNVFRHYNSLDHSGKPVRTVVREVGDMIGVVMRNHLDQDALEKKVKKSKKVNSRRKTRKSTRR